MARPLGSGAIHVYGQFSPSGKQSTASATYYGTTREGPDITEQLDYYPVMNDLTGPRQSMDDGYAGREDIISLVMSSWLESFDQQLEHFLDPTNTLHPRGTDDLSVIGALMLSEGLTLGLWLVKAGAGRTANVNSGMAPGRYYPTCELIGPNKPIEGNKENLRVRIFKAKKDISTISSGFLPLFKEDAGSFAGLPAPTFG